MVESKILCHNCHSKIIEYYDEQYGGNRGKCDNCKIDFPLE